MTLTAGARLGVYEVISALGAGGMGEVYRAHDARLGRDVAIKVLPQALILDPERLHRFELEARATAALNHPNILAIYDVGQDNGCPYLVSELLEGETLRVRLDAGPIPAHRAIEWAIQIARGLAAAHDKGIVHRDLKPDNLLVTEDNRIKILDFGLAKAASPGAAQTTVSVLPTTPPPMQTDAGVVLGTIGYMAPEQVRGLPADPRADIFALGAVLYEMLSGRRAFRGDTPADTMTAILKEHPPDVVSTNAALSPAIARVIDRCLEKNPTARFQSASDLAFALESLSTSSGGSMAVAAREAVATAPRPRARWMLWTATGVAALAALVSVPFAIAHLREAPPPSPPIVRFMVPAPDDALFAGGPGFAPDPTVSPDGRLLVFMARRANATLSTLWIRSLDQLDVRQLPGTEDASFPFWSPDSKSIGFFAGGKLKRVDVASGAAQVVCEAVAGEGGTWSAAGIIVFTKTGSDALSRVSATGGDPVAVTKLTERESSHRWPQFLPDGRRFLYLVEPGNHVRVGSLDSLESSPVVDTNSKALFVPPGYLLFLRNQTLLAQRFDAATATVKGDPVPVAEDVRTGGSNGRAAFSVSATGVLAYRTGAANSRQAQLTWFDRKGQILKTVGPEDDYRSVALSPDETRAAFHKHEDPEGGGLWVIDLVRGGSSRFSFGKGHEGRPIFSPDGTRLVFDSDADGGRTRLYTNVIGGTGRPELLVKSDADNLPTSWVGDTVIFTTMTPTADIWAVSTTGDRTPRAIVQTSYGEYDGRLSPDGKWLAYVSNDSGRNEIYVQPFPSGLRIPISTTGGVTPRWRADGKELFYETSGNGGLERPVNTTVSTGSTSVMSVDVQAAGSTLKASAPRIVFSGDGRIIRAPIPPAANTNTASQNFDVSADGQRFLLLVRPAAPAQSVENPVTVVLNWMAAAAIAR